MNRFTMLFTFLLLTFASVASAIAGKLSIQGHLANGGVSMNGDHTVIFSFFDAPTAGTQLWTEPDTITVVSYLFTATLGKNVPIPLAVFAGSEAWLETTVDGTVLTPRIGYYPQPAPTGTDNVWSTDGTNVWRPGGNVGIGTSTPYHALEAHSTAQGQVGYFHSLSTTGTNYGIDAGAQGTGAETNIGGYFYATGATKNYAIIVPSGAGRVGIGTNSPDAQLEVRGSTEITDDADYPDTRLYASFGVTRAATATNNSYIGLTKQEVVPWALGIGSGTDFIIGTANPSKQIPSPRMSIAYNGTVTIPGNLSVGGTLNVSLTKCREVDTPQYGKIYYNAVESGEAIFTTSGRGQLENGKCHIEINPKWLAGVTINAVHPLEVTTITFYGPHGEFYATPESTGFDVIDPSGSNSSFFWAVQARQKDYADRYLDNPSSVAKR